MRPAACALTGLMTPMRCDYCGQDGSDSLPDQDGGIGELALCLPGVLEGSIPTTPVPIRRHKKGEPETALSPTVQRP